MSLALGIALAILPTGNWLLVVEAFVLASKYYFSIRPIYISNFWKTSIGTYQPIQRLSTCMQISWLLISRGMSSEPAPAAVATLFVPLSRMPFQAYLLLLHVHQHSTLDTVLWNGPMSGSSRLVILLLLSFPNGLEVSDIEINHSAMELRDLALSL